MRADGCGGECVCVCGCACMGVRACVCACAYAVMAGEWECVMASECMHIQVARVFDCENSCKWKWVDTCVHMSACLCVGVEACAYVGGWMRVDKHVVYI